MNSSGQTRQRVTFPGHVQGVGFRATCVEIARNRAVTGWVRNETDGSVAMEAQGAAAEITSFVSEILRVMAGHATEHFSIAAAVIEDERGFRVVY